MHLTAQQVAAACHEANRVLQDAFGDPVSPPWPDTPGDVQASTISGVRQAQQPGITPEALHQSWCEHKVRDGWTHGAVKDETAKTHPCLVPYDELTDPQQLKDRLFHHIVAALTPTDGC